MNKKYKCPLCEQQLEHPVVIPTGFRLFGLSIKQIIKAIDFAKKKNYSLEEDKQ